ncbi:gag-pol polyprotein [Tanacetum coccineum]
MRKILSFATKSCLVLRDYAQKEGELISKSHLHSARLEAVRLFIVYATHKSFTVYQMDVKTAFLYGPLKEEVAKKAIYGLKQSTRAWIDELSKFIQDALQCLQAEAEYVSLSGVLRTSSMG